MKTFLIATMLLTLSIAARAQRMLPGQKGAEIIAGILSGTEPYKNYFVNVSMVVNSNVGNYWLFGGQYSHQVTKYRRLQLPQETYTAEAGYSLQLWANYWKSINVNAALLAVGGYETVNRGNSILCDGAVIQNKEGIVYGAAGRLSVEAYLGDGLVLLLQGRTTGLWNTSLSHFRPSAGLGLRFNF